ncbi:hypothetical protein [Amycolatopsis sp. cmx-8-4]|uniref:hypothetical protein n=1 Tax=Amycolatopsis sp. cmx-8-4 TaxID=2790947 RepID=UPI00397A385F
MNLPLDQENGPSELRLADLNPFLTITVLEAVDDDPAPAFQALKRFLRKTAADRGRANSARIQAEITLGARDLVEETGVLGELGFDELYGVAREVTGPPDWTDDESGFVNVINQLSLAVRRRRLVAICTGIVSDARIARWLQDGTVPFRLLPPHVLTGTFRGDGRMLWARGMHRRRTTKADSRSVGGIRLQDTLSTIEDSTYALTAAKVAYLPADDAAVLRDLITVSPDKSRLSWKRTSHLPMFLAATGEALDLLEKALVADDDPEPPFPEFAVPEADLDRVRGAFDVMIADPDQVRGEPDADEDRVERAELLRTAVIEVRGDENSPVAALDVGFDGAVAGTLLVKPVKLGKAVVLDVRYQGVPSAEPVARQIRDAVAEGDVLTVYYESGHAFTGQQLFRQRLTTTPFPNFDFRNFTGFSITREKPRVHGDQAIHDAIARDGDNSLFAWVVREYSGGWLLCDDGAGEVADFLHLTSDGELTAIHVKAAGNHTASRRIAVTRFEQVVSQAEKNIRQLHTQALVHRLATPRIAAPAAWRDGRRVSSADFVQQLSRRVSTGRTKVVVIQPHLLKSSHDAARAAAAAGKPNRDSGSLALLDNLLLATRRTVTALWDDLVVVGCE